MSLHSAPQTQGSLATSQAGRVPSYTLERDTTKWRRGRLSASHQSFFWHSTLPGRSTTRSVARIPLLWVLHPVHQKPRKVPVLQILWWGPCSIAWQEVISQPLDDTAPFPPEDLIASFLTLDLPVPDTSRMKNMLLSLLASLQIRCPVCRNSELKYKIWGAKWGILRKNVVFS